MGLLDRFGGPRENLDDGEYTAMGYEERAKQISVEAEKRRQEMERASPRTRPRRQAPRSRGRKTKARQRQAPREKGPSPAERIALGPQGNLGEGLLGGGQLKEIEDPYGIDLGGSRKSRKNPDDILSQLF
jgi:hypothetical protein